MKLVKPAFLSPRPAFASSALAPGGGLVLSLGFENVTFLNMVDFDDFSFGGRSVGVSALLSLSLGDCCLVSTCLRLLRPSSSSGSGEVGGGTGDLDFDSVGILRVCSRVERMRLNVFGRVAAS